MTIKDNPKVNWSDKIMAECIGEEPPPCQAACPLDIRVREKLRLMQQGDLAGALAVVLRATVRTVPNRSVSHAMMRLVSDHGVFRRRIADVCSIQNSCYAQARNYATSSTSTSHCWRAA